MNECSRTRAMHIRERLIPAFWAGRKIIFTDSVRLSAAHDRLARESPEPAEEFSGKIRRRGGRGAEMGPLRRLSAKLFFGVARAHAISIHI
jgi:hypothetical protein